MEDSQETQQLLKESQKKLRAKRRTFIFALIAQIILLPFWGMSLIMSPMMFDAPGSENSLTNWIFLAIVLLLPLVLAIYVWTSYNKGLYRRANILSLIMLFPVWLQLLRPLFFVLLTLLPSWAMFFGILVILIIVVFYIKRSPMNRR